MLLRNVDDKFMLPVLQTNDSRISRCVPFIFVPLRNGNFSVNDFSKSIIVLGPELLRVAMTETAIDRMRKVKSILVTQEAPTDLNSPYLKLAHGNRRVRVHGRLLV